MFRRTEIAVTDDGRQPELTTSTREESAVRSRPNLSGDLEDMVGDGPCFRVSVRGYDRLQVDNYVAWAEEELLAARLETDDLASRLGACLAELETARELLRHSPEGRELSRISDRMADMLRLAADEAADVTAAGRAEAERILGEARAEADAVLRRAREIEQAAALASERSREEAAELLRNAAAERVRLDAEAADARARAAAASAERLAMEEQRVRREHEAEEAARRAAVNEEIEELKRQREHLRACCHGLTEQLREALEALVEGMPGEPPVLENRVRG
jgi:cell division septum initiation protein DivIVA